MYEIDTFEVLMFKLGLLWATDTQVLEVMLAEVPLLLFK